MGENPERPPPPPLPGPSPARRILGFLSEKAERELGYVQDTLTGIDGSFYRIAEGLERLADVNDEQLKVLEEIRDGQACILEAFDRCADEETKNLAEFFHIYGQVMEEGEEDEE